MKLPENRPKIKRGQFWQKKDTGQIVQITGKIKKDYYSTRKPNRRNNTHSIYKKDLYLFWQLIK